MKKGKSNVWGAAFMAAIMVAVIAVITMQASDCNDSGGKFVRGFIWFECIDQ